MSEELYPYIIFLPAGRKQRVLRSIFGSKVPIDILNFSISQGISKKVYQKDLIESLHYSNKTVIEHLKALTNLGILKEHMEKSKRGGRTFWIKCYTLSDSGKWFALLLAKEDALSKGEKAEIIQNVLQSYIKWVKKLLEKLDVDENILKEIFVKEIQ